MTSIKLGLAQINPTVGDIEGNLLLVLSALETSKKRGLDVVIFPELVLTGYPPEDLLLRKDFQAAVEHALVRIAQKSLGIAAIVGHPHLEDNSRYNAASLLSMGKIMATYRKQILPNFGVFDEKRYFSEGTSSGLFEVNGVKLGVLICEDLWHPGPAQSAQANGADALIILNASPFHQAKLAQRQAVAKDRVLETGLPLIYINLIGGQDELVFDGASFALNSSGDLCLQAPSFEEGLYEFDFSLAHSGGPMREEASHSPPDELALIYQALVIGIRDYARKNGFEGAILGLSGGVDSALTLTLAVDALGATAVEAVLLPSRYTLDMSNEDALEQVRRLGCRSHTLPIEAPFESFLETLAPLFDGLSPDLTEENIQARCRGTLLMALSNKRKKLLLTTGNKSEMSVGYATLYGDMAGGFAPLKDIPKMKVYALARHRNRLEEIIPERVLTRAPTAELRHNQKDEDSLPPYPILDQVLERYVEQDDSIEAIIETGLDPVVVRRIVELVDRSEYKRRQSPPGVKVTSRAFGRDRRYPMTNGFKPSKHPIE